MAEMVFKWKPGARLTGDPMQVGTELEKIRTKSGGLTAKAVVSTAQDKKNPLHGYFTWDNRVAAQKCREHEARHLMASVMVQFVENSIPGPVVHAFVAVGDKEDRYQDISTALSQEDLRDKLLKQALSELNSFAAKYRSLKELAKVFEAIDLTLKAG